MIKSNNPHLAGGEKQTFCQHALAHVKYYGRNMWAIRCRQDGSHKMASNVHEKAHLYGVVATRFVDPSYELHHATSHLSHQGVWSNRANHGKRPVDGS